jgi:uncharacterized protein involved in response to NO
LLTQLLTRGGLSREDAWRQTVRIAHPLWIVGLSPAALFLPLRSLPIFLIFAAGAISFYRLASSTRERLGAVTLLLFLSVSALFLRLAVSTERVIAAGGLPSAGPVATFQIPEVEECYREYRRVPGFEDKKASMRAFLKN